MMRIVILVALLLLAGASIAPRARAQAGNTVIITAAGAPVGSCPFIMLYDRSDASELYACRPGVGWFLVGPGAAGATTWSSLTNPTGNLALTMGAFTSTFTYNAATGAANLYRLTDTLNNTGTGYALQVDSATGSVLNLARFCANGTTNCIVISSAAALSAAGTASVVATDLQAASEVVSDAEVVNTITLTNITQITNRAIGDTTGDLAASRVDDGGAASTQALFSGGVGAAGFRAIVDADVPNTITVDLATSSSDLTCTNCIGPTEITDLALGTDTSGNFVDDVTAGIGIAVTHTPAEGSDAAVAFTFADAGADPALGAGGATFSNEGASAAGVVFEGDTNDTFETRLRVTDPTVADRIVTIPNADSNTVQPLTCTGDDKVSAISALGVITCTTDQLGAGGGDAITVNTTAVADPDFITTGTVSVTENLVPTPDTISWAVVANSITAAHIDETTAYAFSATTNTFVSASYTDGSGAAAGSGVLRAANNIAVLGVEVAPAGADCTMTLDASEIFQLANCTLDAADLSGTVPDASINGANEAEEISLANLASRACADLSDESALCASSDIDSVTGQANWGTAATKETADLIFTGVEADFDAGAANAWPRLLNEATPTGTDCDAAGEAGRLLFDPDLDTDGSVMVCRGAAGWKDIDDDGGAGGGSVGYALTTYAGNLGSVVDATTYYYGGSAAAAVATADQMRLYIPTTGTITKAFVSVVVRGTLASGGEDSEALIRLNNTTDTSVSTTLEHNAVYNTVSNTGLSIAVTQGDYVEIKIIAATFSVNPTTVFYSAVLWITE